MDKLEDLIKRASEYEFFLRIGYTEDGYSISFMGSFQELAVLIPYPNLADAVDAASLYLTYHLEELEQARFRGYAV